MLVEILRCLAQASLLGSGVALVAAGVQLPAVVRTARVLWARRVRIAELPDDLEWVAIHGRIRATDGFVPSLTDGREAVFRRAPDRVVRGIQRWETATVPFVVEDDTGAVEVRATGVLSPLVVWGTIRGERAHEELLRPGDAVTVRGRIGRGAVYGWVVREHRSLLATAELRALGTTLGFAVGAAAVAVALAVAGISLG